MKQIMIKYEVTLEIDKISMSNETVTHRISYMLADIKEYTIEKMKNFRFMLQVDVSTSNDGKCYMIEFDRSANVNAVVSQFLCLKQILEVTIFLTQSIIFLKIMEYLCNCVGICTDGTPIMTESIKRFVTLAKIKNSLIVKTHCFIHREVLVTKTLGNKLNSIVINFVRMIN